MRPAAPRFGRVIRAVRRSRFLRRKGKNSMNTKLRDMNLELLFNAVLKLQNMEECSNFFEDLCTVQELKAISQRIQVAALLMDGTVYSDIVKATGASTATISRVNRSLNYGSDGYRVIFDRLKADGKL